MCKDILSLDRDESLVGHASDQEAMDTNVSDHIEDSIIPIGKKEPKNVEEELANCFILGYN